MITMIVIINFRLYIIVIWIIIHRRKSCLMFELFIEFGIWVRVKQINSSKIWK
jgi:hypothetical protein